MTCYEQATPTHRRIDELTVVRRRRQDLVRDAGRLQLAVDLGRHPDDDPGPAPIRRGLSSRAEPRSRAPARDRRAEPDPVETHVDHVAHPVHLDDLTEEGHAPETASGPRARWCRRTGPAARARCGSVWIRWWSPVTLGEAVDPVLVDPVPAGDPEIFVAEQVVDAPVAGHDRAF